MMSALDFSEELGKICC